MTHDVSKFVMKIILLVIDPGYMILTTKQGALQIEIIDKRVAMQRSGCETRGQAPEVGLLSKRRRLGQIMSGIPINIEVVEGTEGLAASEPTEALGKAGASFQ